jgi:hypothetical protein
LDTQNSVDILQVALGAHRYAVVHPWNRVQLGHVSQLALDSAGRVYVFQRTGSPIVVLTHRPLFDLAPQWDWATRDGDAAIEILMPYRNLTVFYGHIHQQHHHMTGHIAHHAAMSLMFPLPAPGSQPKRDPLRWDPAHPFRGLGFREIEDGVGAGKVAIDEHLLGEA